MTESAKPRRVEEHQSPATGERLADIVGLLILLFCLACPWILWFVWGPWIGLAGIVISHVLYMILLAPQRGICLGLSWIFVAVNALIALIAMGATGLWRMLT
jgi:hypothetical protein